MSGEKATSPCSNFQANIFNKTKCQNCFKSRELHLLNDHDMEQAKPVYGGWLCLAPEGTDFDNPMQRSRKWQRRFFILYENGSLSFALDELTSTLPQGTMNLNLCTEIVDAEPRTGQKNALCIVTLEKEIFIRGDNKEIINGWNEQLAVYLRTNKQNLKKKRKVEPVANQEPSPAKMAATYTSFPSLEATAESSCDRWQEEQPSPGPNVTPMWTVIDTDPPDLAKTPTGDTSIYLSPDENFLNPVGSLDLVASRNINLSTNNQVAESSNMQTAADNKNQNQHQRAGSSAERLLGLETAKKEQEGGAAVSRKGRSEARTSKRELQSCGDITQLTAPPSQRRSRSLDRRTSDSIMTPDLLNFKKGWMVKLDENNQWKKYWFVLSTDSLRFYKDSIAEEASDLEGEIDLTKCYNVSEYQVQRNYGFQIHTPKGVYTLSAMTSGIRKNWIQALMKNVHPANAPDVASHHGPYSPSEVLPKPDVTQDSSSAEVPADPHPKRRTIMERRQEGHYKTFDWAEFRTQKQKHTLDADPQSTEPVGPLELGDLERRKRREERRRRYEGMLGISLLAGDNTGNSRALRSPLSQKAEEEIEECWKLVETTLFRLEKKVPLRTEASESVHVEKLLDSYRKGVEDLKAQLCESERRRLELEAQLRTAGLQQQQDPPPAPEASQVQSDSSRAQNGHTETLKDTCTEVRELMRQSMKEPLSLETPSVTRQTPGIWLHDPEGNLQQLTSLLSETESPALSVPACDSQDLFSQSDGDATKLDPDVATTNRQNQLGGCQEAPINNDFSSLILEKSEDASSLPCCVEHHKPPDEVVVRRLSQELELLTSQNEALNQRNQEMLNQLTEADREIERLKAELSSRYTQPHHLPEVEQLQQELNLRNQQLTDAQALIASLEESLRETELLLQLNIPEETELENSEVAEKAEGHLLRCLEAAEARLQDLERQLQQTETACGKLQTQDAELMEADRTQCETAAEVEEGGERIQQVMEAMVMRLSALGRLLEVMDKLDVGLRKEGGEEEVSPVVSQLKWEEEFWSSVLHKLKPLQLKEEKPVEVLLSEVAQCLVVEKQMLLLGHDLFSQTEEGRESLKALDMIWNSAGVTVTGSDEGTTHDFTEQLRVITHMKMSLLNHLASSVGTSTQEKLQLMTSKFHSFQFSEHPWSTFIHSAAAEALYCCHLKQLQSKYERELEQTKQKAVSSVICSSCADLMKENRELIARLFDLEDQINRSTEERRPQDTAGESQVVEETPTEGTGEEDVRKPPEPPEEEMVEPVELGSAGGLSSCDDGLSATEEAAEENTERCGASQLEPDASCESEQVLALRRRAEELEEQLSIMDVQMREELDEKMSCLQMQHEQKLGKLKVTCERSFASMEESHVKVVDELQRRHRQEVERLLVERDRLLEEESAATATAIKAIKKAHELELEREVQRRCQCEMKAGNTRLEHVYRQHSEELSSYQRELQGLSQQFSLKCLENGHLVQALDAERKALCQCQQENQDLRTRNQELSGHLAAEITRLCSLAKQDALPLNQEMDVYEMEITLRVKESEVQCLKQEITSLKEEVQSAHRDKRNATKKYKDMYTELSILRAKTERDMDELRENLRLAHRALDQTSPRAATSHFL
ncbi:uncharacterized protein V6R79_022619 [Siganus canaliculatus]